MGWGWDEYWDEDFHEDEDEDEDDGDDGVVVVVAVVDREEDDGTHHGDDDAGDGPCLARDISDAGTEPEPCLARGIIIKYIYYVSQIAAVRLCYSNRMRHLDTVAVYRTPLFSC